MKIIASRGNSEYLLVRDDVTDIEWDTDGRVLDDEEKRLYPWDNIHSLFARGYWSEYNGSQTIVEPMVQESTEVIDNNE